VIYLITFVCYGCHLHGSDRALSTASTMCMEPQSSKWIQRARQPRGNAWIQAPYNLDQIRRDAVLEAIQEVCTHRGWSLLAAHVRSSHVHTVVGSGGSAGAGHERLQRVRQPPSESDEAG